MAVYKGRYSGMQGQGYVTVDRQQLPPRNDLVNHSPDGFAWGYGGSGPSQLALALLAHHFGDDGLALRYYQQFKWEVVTSLPEEWRLTTEQINKALRRMGQP